MVIYVIVSTGSEATWTTGTSRRYTARVSRIRAIVLVFCLMFAVLAMAVPWVGRTAGGVRIYVHPREERLAQEIGAMAGKELPRVADALGVTVPRPFPIYVYANHVEFMHDTGIDPNLRGLSVPPMGKIYLDATTASDAVQRTLAHELTHSLLDQRLGDYAGSLPVWVNEGIAGHLSEPVSPRELPQISRMLHNRGVLSLEEMEQAFALRNEQNGAAYLQSRSMVAWLVLHHPHALREIFNNLTGSDSFTNALYRATGLVPQDWLQQWQQNIPAFVYWISLLTSPLIYAPLAFLAIWAVLARRKRKEEEEARAAAEEEYEDEEAEREAEE